MSQAPSTNHKSDQSAPLTANQVTKGVISYLSRNNSLGLLPQIAQQALKVAKPQTDPNTAIIESVIPLSPKQLETVQSWLKTQLKRDRIEMVNRTNPNLIGGIKIKIADLVIDQTIASQVDQLVMPVQSRK